ncbi:unnamed protein product [Mucor hiemalis]
MSSLRLTSGFKSMNKVISTTRQIHMAAPVMSHIGRKAIAYSQEVRIEHDMTPIVEPLIFAIKPFVKINLTPAPKDNPNTENILQVSVENDGEKQQRAMWGTTRALINNAIIGVSDGYKTYLRLVGVGYRGVLENNNRVLSLKLGYSHPIQMDLPEGVTCTVPAPNRIILQGANLQHVTEFAAKIQRWRMPEPYNQKGIFINDETIKKKEGKKK